MNGLRPDRYDSIYYDFRNHQILPPFWSSITINYLFY